LKCWEPENSRVMGIVFAGVGKIIQMSNGFPERFSEHLQLVNNQFEFNMPECPNCSKEVVDFNQFPHECFTHDTTREPTVIILGDSHAQHYTPGLFKYFASKGENPMTMKKCLSFKSSTPGTGLRKECVEYNNHLYDWIKNSPSIKKVIFASRFTNYTTNEKDKKWLGDSFLTSVEFLLNENKKIILIHEIPKMNFDPHGCVKLRPYLLGQLNIGKCFSLRNKLNTNQEDYRKILNKTLKKFPQIVVFDPLDFLCDNKKCFHVEGDFTLYRDDNHLSTYGSMNIAKNFKF